MKRIKGQKGNESKDLCQGKTTSMFLKTGS